MTSTTDTLNPEDLEIRSEYTLRYGLLGAAFGLVFPLVATLIVLYESGQPFSLAAAIEAHLTMPLLWIIDSAPIFLGLFAALVGRREDRFQATNRQLQQLIQSLELRATDRARDLNRTVDVSHTVTQVRNLEDMLREAVELIRSSFNLYYVQIFLTDEIQQNLILRAGTGPIGLTLVNQNRRLPINLSTLIGTAGIERRTVIIADTTASPLYESNPQLGKTKAEMAMPLLIGDQLIGILDLHSDRPGRFGAEDLPALEAVAGQLAIAVENARLVSEVTEAQVETEIYARRMARSGWQEFLNAVDRPEIIGYAYENDNLQTINQSLDSQRVPGALEVPIIVTGEPVGTIQVQGKNGEPWTRDEADLIAAVADQVARQVESLRLLAEADHYREEAEEATRRLTREGWDEYLGSQNNLISGYDYDLATVKPLLGELDSESAGEPALIEALKIRGEPVGQIEIAETQSLDQDAAELIVAVAEQLSTHLESLRLTEQRERALADIGEQARRLAALNELSQGLAGAATVDEVYRIAAAKTKEIVPGDRISVTLLDADGQNFDVLAIHPDRGASPVGRVRAGDSSVLSLAVNKKRVILVNETGGSGGPEIESLLVAPLTAGGRTFGTYNVGSKKTRAFDTRDERLLLQVASLIASTLESLRLLSETQQRAEELADISRLAQTRAKELAILNEMGQELTSEVEIDAVIATIHHHASRLIEAESIYLALYDADTDIVDIQIFGEGEEVDLVTLRRQSGEGITEHVIRTGEPLLIADHMEDFVTDLGIEPHGRMAASWLGVPMIAGDRVTGLIAAQSFDRANAFDEHDLDLLTAVASQAAIAIENTRLFEQVQARARREQILREITARVRSSADVDSVMRTAAEEVGRALGRQTFVYLSEDDESKVSR